MGTEVGKEPAVSCLPRTLSSEKRCSRQLGPAGADPADGGASSWGWGEGTRDPQAPDLLWSQWGGAEAGQLFTRHSLKEDRCVSIFLSEDGNKASVRPAAFLGEGRRGALPVGRRPFYRWGNRGGRDWPKDAQQVGAPDGFLGHAAAGAAPVTAEAGAQDLLPPSGGRGPRCARG